MGFRRHTFLLSVTFALALVACGDNLKPVYDDAGVQQDGPPDAPDAMPDALMCGAAPNMICNNMCADTSTDEANCGSCGNACTTGQTCDMGVCCDPGENNCGGTCYDLQTDNDHCGGCAAINDCTTGQTCMNGTCCGGTNTACGNQCFDLEINQQNCGACDNECGVNNPGGADNTGLPVCSSGHCCATGQTWCGPDVGGSCVDLMSDEVQCGACAGDVNRENCTTSGANNTCCGGNCINPQSDEPNCGDCSIANGGTGDTCMGLETCDTGVCCLPGTIHCSGNSCVDPLDEAQCGGCVGGGGTGEMCLPGESCLGTDPATAECCPPGTINCNGTCVDPLNDPNNCGNCAGASNPTGVDCPAGTPFCSGGQCTTGCGSLSNCNGTCVDLNSDNLHCGSSNGTCGVACAANEICNNGTCQTGTTCSGTETLCAGDCVDTSNDPDHCGNCGTICPFSSDPGETRACVNSSCTFTCSGGQTFCTTTSNGVPPNSCYDLQTDEQACGACNTPCAAGSTCFSGMCCPSGTIRCGNSCINPTNNNNNCGDCGNGMVSDDNVCDVANGEVCKPTGAPLGGICCQSTDSVCGGQCSNPQSDEANCGACIGMGGDLCAASETCLSGLCCDTASEENVMGKCCPIGNLNCNINGTPTCIDRLTDHDNCGACGNNCGSDQCVNGFCQASCDPPLETTCGTCANSDYDPNFCATATGCKKCAAGGATCADADCRDNQDDDSDGRVNDGCPASGTPEILCTDVLDNDGDGFINDGCPAISSSGPVLGEGDEASNALDPTCQCPTTAPTVCGAVGMNPGTCVNTQTSDSNCGACGTTCTGGTTCTSGLCCLPGQVRCGNSCVDLDSDEVNCGACAGTCTGGSNNGNPCAVAGDCPSGTCNGAAPGGEVCKAGQVCTDGDCDCPFNSISCPSGCKIASVDPANCGTCGNVCGVNNAGGLNNTGKPYCVSNSCVAACPAPLIACGSGNSAKCVNPDTDSNNCGGCAGAGGVVCANNQLPNGQGCVDGGCVAKLPLTQDPVLGPLLTARCVGGGPPIEFPNDSGGTTCSGNLAATAFTFGMCSRTQVDVPAQIFTDAFNSNFGAYRPVGLAGTNLACNAANLCVGNTGNPGATCNGDIDCLGKCVGGTNAGTNCVAGSATCTPGGGVCSNVGNCQSVDCPGGLMCLGAGTALDPKTCVGGGLGINGGPTGTVNPLLKTQQTGHVGGSFWAFGSIGLDIAKTMITKERIYNEGPFKYASNGHKVYGDAFINGPFSAQGGQAAWDIDGKLTYDYTGMGAVQCPPPGASGMTVGNPVNGAGQCIDAIWDQSLLAPCGEQSDLTKNGGWDIPVSKTLTGTALPPGGIVEYFRNPANNDNKAIGLKYNAISAATGDVRLDLPCGYYYLDNLVGSNKVTIVVSGRVALFIGGNADINVEMQFDVQPTGSLDMFVGGVINIAHSITLGSPAYPRLTRLYIGRASTGTGSCTTVSDCASGTCSACAGVSATWTGYGACTGTGTCTGSGTGRSPSINMSQGGYFNGLLWAGYGGFSTSNNVEMYGSIFADAIGASGDLKVHYDNGAAQAVDECPPPPPGTQTCESCRDCGNQPCGGNGLCASGVVPGQPTSTCTADNQCCPPLHCDIGGTNRCVL